LARSRSTRVLLACLPGSSIYFFLAAGLLDGMAISIGVLAPAESSFLTGSIILSAFFTSTVTCQICVSVNASLNPGMPVNRMPFSVFQ
jgi:hypothetical protein